MAKYNDLDKDRWKEYEDVFTDTLWLIEKRDNTGVHNASYHGNFIPQIPNQLFRRYTKKGDWVLDPFMGSGTSLIEAQRLERNCVGIEIQENVAKEAYGRILLEQKDKSSSKICIGNSKTIDLSKVMQNIGIDKFQFVIMHPPYWNILKFSDNPNDLSNATTLKDFLRDLEMVIDNTCRYLQDERYCAVVIGDKYENSEIVPLGFLCMNLFLQKGYLLKSIIVKNFEQTKAKINQTAIWRYRALASDFYIFKHEYIFLFKKTKSKKKNKL